MMIINYYYNSKENQKTIQVINHSFIYSNIHFDLLFIMVQQNLFLYFDFTFQ